MLARGLTKGLQGIGAHVHTAGGLQALDWQLAGRRPAGSPHTIWQILNHMTFWQDFLLARLRGANPAVPEHAAGSWPGGDAPATAAEWAERVAHFAAGLEAALQEVEAADLAAPIASRPEQTRFETLMQIVGHNSYHVGQIALLRRMLGSWPPPGGGDTW